MAPIDSLPPYSRFDDIPPCYDPDQALAEFNALSKDQQAHFSRCLSEAASGDDAISQFQEAATDAAAAAIAIDELFDSFTSKLENLNIYDENFVYTFQQIHSNYRTILSKSYAQASDIANYAASFEEVVIVFCADKTLDVEDRKRKIYGFIQEGETIKQEAQALEKSFSDLKTDLTDFLSDFSSWAKSREEEDEQEVAELYQDIANLDSQLSTLDAAIEVLSAAMAVTLPITGILALVFPPAAPWILIAGCAIAGLELASVVGLHIAKNNVLKQKQLKEDAIKNLEGDISEIKATRTQLEQDGKTYLTKFRTNINAFSKTWVHVQSDAREVMAWLEDGAHDADQTLYMRLSLEGAVRVYTSMAEYLKKYAEGTQSAVQGFKEAK